MIERDLKLSHHQVRTFTTYIDEFDTVTKDKTSKRTRFQGIHDKIELKWLLLGTNTALS